MAADQPSVEAEIDGLYGLPLEQFIPARDDLAKRLRSAQNRDGAEHVKGLRKPSVAAWALNQLRWQDPATVEELIAAGERLRKAQERLLAAGERGALREAATSERELVERLAQAGERLLADAGHPLSAATQTRLWATLRSVAGDQEARELLAAGRLVRDHEVSDLGLGLGAGPPKVPSRKAPPAAGGGPAREQDRVRRPGGAAVARKARSIEQQLARARERRRAAAQKLDEVQQEAKAAAREADAARREAERAASALERAQAAAERSRGDARAAAERVGELEAEQRELEAELG